MIMRVKESSLVISTSGVGWGVGIGVGVGNGEGSGAAEGEGADVAAKSDLPKAGRWRLIPKISNRQNMVTDKINIVTIFQRIPFSISSVYMKIYMTRADEAKALFPRQ